MSCIIKSQSVKGRILSGSTLFSYLSFITLNIIFFRNDFVPTARVH